MASDNIKNNSRLVVFTLLLTAFFAVLIFTFISMSSITEDGVKKRLQEFADFVASESAAAGKTGTFTYGPIGMQGWGSERIAAVAQPNVSITGKETPASKWSFTTPQMVVQSAAADPHNQLFVIPGPITILENDQPKSTISFLSALTYSYRDGFQNSKRIVSHSFQLPGQITFAPAGAVVGTPGQVTISYDSNPTVAIDILPDDHERQSAYEFHNLKVDPGTGDTASVGVLTSRLNEAPGQDGRQHGKYTLSVTDIVLNEGGKVTAPYNIVADVDYSGDRPVLPLTSLTAPFTGSSDITVNSITLGNGAFTIRAQGALQMATGDAMPFGTLTIDIDNINQMLASELIPEWSRLPLLDLIRKITGNPAPEAHVVFPLKREKNGVLYVGNVTFDEAYNTVITALQKPTSVPVTGAATTSAPVAPVATAPAAVTPPVSVSAAAPTPAASAPAAAPAPAAPAVSAPAAPAPVAPAAPAVSAPAPAAPASMPTAPPPPPAPAHP